MSINKQLPKNTFKIRRVVGYSEFFPGEKPIDIFATLKLYSRTKLVRMAAILSLHYGNMSIPDDNKTLFSEISEKHGPYLNKLFKAYYKRLGMSQKEQVVILTYRTSLELWRQIFAIRTDEYTDQVEACDAELLLFKVILSLNEKLLKFNERDDLYKFDELLFLNGFLTNDNNSYDLKTVLQSQIYYFQQLVSFIPSSKVLSMAWEKLLADWGVESWLHYFATIVYLAKETDKYINAGESGLPIISPDLLRGDSDANLLSISLIENLCIEEDEYIPCTVDRHSSHQLNIDYRRFRSKPFVKLKDGSGYIVINNQILCERLFNSLYFDFMPLINGKNGSCGFFNYNKDFIERVLFRKTFFNCIRPHHYTYPNRKGDTSAETLHEPDFYIRTKQGELVLVECKAIKMNGESRDDGDYVRLLDELKEKIVLKTRNLDKNRKEHKGKPEPIGIGQLIHHINSIEDDHFEWDSYLPNEVIYYPILVFEDIKLTQTGVLPIVNRWFYEAIETQGILNLKETACMPVMVVSINTLYLYDEILRRKGLTNLIDSFVEDNAIYDSTTGRYNLNPTADFDAYLRRNPYNKSKDMQRWMREMRTGFNLNP